MKIGLDFDGTITEDPQLWAAFILRAIKRHQVTIVTFRVGPVDAPDNKDIRMFLSELGLNVPVIFTAGKQKADCYSADVWIDDMPILIPSKDVLLLSGLTE